MLPELYAQQVAKYRGRERLTLVTVPVVNALWNDLVHCAPIHPRVIYRALANVGIERGSDTFFKIPVSQLEGMSVVWFDPWVDPARGDYPFPLDERDVTLFDRASYRELTQLPARTVRYYEQARKGGRRPLLYQFVPHVLVHGSIDVADVEVIDWKD